MKLKSLIKRLVRRPASADYRVIDASIARSLRNGWRSSVIARRQQKAFAPLIKNLESGLIRQDFQALGEAVQATGLIDPLIIEVGCGGGWNAIVLEKLLRRPVRYAGVDFSEMMIILARQAGATRHFLVGDATALPLRAGACDVLVSGTSLMHILDYRAAIQESRRVTRRWCIFHSVPLLQRAPTALLSKKAYGVRSIEITFNETELRRIFAEEGFQVRQTFPSLAYDLQHVVGEPTLTKTFLCEISA